MQKILKKGYWKILELFYNGKDKKIHLRDIARQTKMNENSASRFLIALEKEGILKSEKEGNMKKYSIRKNNITYSILTLFDIERFNKLPLLRKNAIGYFFKELKEKPIVLFLFGSTAKETFTNKSDIDLLMVVNKKINVEEAKRSAEAQTGIRISCFQIEYKDFLRELKTQEDKVIGSAIMTGYPLTNHIKFYEEYYGD
jgi:DNA-binding Lrp family transcriptional regulator